MDQTNRLYTKWNSELMWVILSIGSQRPGLVVWLREIENTSSEY